MILEVGQTKTITFNLTRKDISNWDPVAQDWVVTEFEKTVYVGASSRDFRLEGGFACGACSQMCSCQVTATIAKRRGEDI